MTLVPSFNKNQILKAEMLAALRDNPVHFMNTLFEGYCDGGVIEGFSVAVDESDHAFRISPGLIKIDGLVYVVQSSLSVDIRNKMNIVYLDKEEHKSVNGTELIFVVTNEAEERESGIELFRCYKSETSKIKLPESFDDIYVEASNTINYTHSLRSLKGGLSVRPEILEVFAKELLVKSHVAVKDVVFAYKCLDGISNFSVIESYFDLKGQCTNKELLKHMKVKLNNLQENRYEERDEQKPVKRPVMEID